jgi:hypothetical protein
MNIPGSESEISREELLSVLFAEMVIQQTNMAMIFLGIAPNPETGKKMRDLETAKLFIDQLEMLEVKTKGNLSKEEEQLLKQSLTQLRLAFVQISNQPEQPAAGPEAAPKSETPPKTEATAETEERKKFTKKY